MSPGARQLNKYEGGRPADAGRQRAERGLIAFFENLSVNLGDDAGVRNANRQDAGQR